MSLFGWFQKKENRQQTTNPVEAAYEQKNDPDRSEISEANRLVFLVPVSEEEKELVSVIASAIAAGDHPDSKIRVKNVMAVDAEKEIVAVIAAALAAEDYPNSHFHLKSIKRIN
jgi:hypothetical protein